MPSNFRQQISAPNEQFARLIYCGLAAKTRDAHRHVQRNYELFCSLEGHRAWPATVRSLGAYVARRAHGAPLMFRQIKPVTIYSYLSCLRSYHVDRGWSVEVFADPLLKRMLVGARSLFPGNTAKKDPLTLDMLSKITKKWLHGPDEFNVRLSALFLVAFFGLFRIGELTYDTKDLKKMDLFRATKLTRGDVAIIHDRATITLKRSKTDTNHEGVTVTLAASPNPFLCPVRALTRVLNLPGYMPWAPLFGITKKEFALKLDYRLKEVGIYSNVAGHSFRRGGAQLAYQSCMDISDIKRLGRWVSGAVANYLQPCDVAYELNARLHTSPYILTNGGPLQKGNAAGLAQVDTPGQAQVNTAGSAQGNVVGTPGGYPEDGWADRLFENPPSLPPTPIQRPKSVSTPIQRPKSVSTQRPKSVSTLNPLSQPTPSVPWDLITANTINTDGPGDGPLEDDD